MNQRQKDILSLSLWIFSLTLVLGGTLMLYTEYGTNTPYHENIIPSDYDSLGQNAQFIKAIARTTMAILETGIPVFVVLVIHRLMISFRFLMENKNAKHHKASGKYFERFNFNQRIQHYVCATSCLILFITGLIAKYGALGQYSIFFGGFDGVAIAHRMAALGILVLAVYHMAYYTFDRQWNNKKEMLPSKLDILNIIQDTKYALWMSNTKGQYRKYAYREKLDYWGAIIFFPILIASGLLMWHPIFIAEYLFSPEYLPAMAVVHTSDAILAGMAIMLHMYNVHLCPEQFPANWTMFTGAISEEQAKEEFPLWYEEIAPTADD